MKVKLACMACLVLIASVSCRQRDDRAVIVSVPEMRNGACATLIQGALSKMQGIRWDQTEIDVTRRTVTVTYDSMGLSQKNVEFVIAKAGFKANDVPADPEAAAALPDECRR